jgi:hypothetical protein
MSWNINPLNKEYINPIKRIGQLIVNCRVHKALAARGRSAARPYYPNPVGSSAGNHELVRDGSIAYTITSSRAVLATSVNDGSGGAGDPTRTKMAGLMLLNGQGDADDVHGALMERIAFVGVIETGNQDTKSMSYSCMHGGIRTMTNNGNETIHVGDYIRMYAPSREELGEGGLKNQSAQNGEIELWMKPFDPYKHHAQPASILACLEDLEDPTIVHNRLPAYVHACQAVEQAIHRCGLVVAVSIGHRGMRDIVNASTNDQSFAIALNRALKVPAHHKAIRENAFVPYSEGRLFVPGATHGDGGEVNIAQRECLSGLLRALSVLQHMVEKDVIGRALTTARPGENINVELARYGH